MVFVVNKADNKILNRIDAWIDGAVQEMRDWCKKKGWIIVDDEITFMGDMVIWVE